MDRKIEKAVVSKFVELIEAGYASKDAVATLDYYIVVKHNHEFYNLSEEDQARVRDILHSLKLVHV
jgi:hypothetical protein